MRDRITVDYPEAVINLKTIDGLDYIKKDSKGLKIGALAKLADVAKSPDSKGRVQAPRGGGLFGGEPPREEHGHRGRQPRPGRTLLVLPVSPTTSAAPSSASGRGARSAAPCRATTGITPSSALRRSTSTPAPSHCPVKTNIPSYLSKVRKGDFGGGRPDPDGVQPPRSHDGKDLPRLLRTRVQPERVRRGRGDPVHRTRRGRLRPRERRQLLRAALEGDGQEGRHRRLGPGRACRRILPEDGPATGLPCTRGMAEAGGMLRYSIPPYRLPKDVVKKQIKALEGMGIVFKLGVEVGTGDRRSPISREAV